MEPITYISFALLTIIPIVMFSIHAYNETEGKSSWRTILMIIIGYLTIITFFYDILENHSEGQIYILKRVYIGLTAFIPAVAYMLYITAFDSKKPEPTRLLLLTAFIGCIAAFTVTAIGLPIYHGGFYSEINYGIVDSFKIGFLKIAIPSEAIKWLFLLIFLSINKYYDEYLDGIVYSVCLALGFACVLGIGYMFDFVKFSFPMFVFKGLVTALILIPTHMMAGTVMGYFFGLARKRNKILYITTALGTAILVDGLICTMLALMGGHWGYYSIIGVVLLILALAFYRQVWHLMKLDNI